MIQACHIPAMMAPVALAACVTSPLAVVEGTGALNVTEVDVAVSVPLTGRQTDVMAEQLARDLDGTLSAVLGEASDPDGTPVTVSIDVLEARLAPPIERVAAGASFIRAAVSVTRPDGRIVVPATEVSGNSDRVRLIGVLGVATTPSVENDYRGTVRGFAATVRDALFGEREQ